MATVTFSSTFSKVAGLDSQIISFIRKLQQHPEDPGLNLKKPKGAKDRNVRTARINKQYRAVLFDLPGRPGAISCSSTSSTTTTPTKRPRG